MKVSDLFNPAAKEPRRFLADILALPLVPARCPPCAADLWLAVRRDPRWMRATDLAVEEEVGRRYDAACASETSPELFAEVPRW